jgi:hypothetical protein
MKHIKLYEEFLNEEDVIVTQKKAALDFVEKKGKATWKEIHTFLMKNKGFDPNDTDNRGRMASYFSGGSTFITRMYGKNTNTKTGRDRFSHGLLMIPTLKDPRYLDKQDDGTYVVKVWDKKSKLDS